MSEPAKIKIDTRPKRGAWAPGDYFGICCECRAQFIGDKRAQQCADCVYGEPVAPTPEPEMCEWREDEDGQWFAECGAAWTFFESGPDENGMSFCYCCGKALLPIAYQQYAPRMDALEQTK